MADKSFPETIPDGFWKIIEDARQDPTRFREMLKKMNRGALTRLYWTYEELANRLRTEDYSSYADPDLSEDGLAELANWVVAQGREYYTRIFHHPELIPAKKNDAGLMSEMVEEHEQRYKSDLPENTHEWDYAWKQHGKKSPWS
jgi:uncharacterized protein DUF4240